MTKVVIVVKDGMVQEVFGNDNIEIELLDFDDQDTKVLKEKEKRYEEIQSSKSFKEIV